jgi:hypothetical protein
VSFAPGASQASFYLKDSTLSYPLVLTATGTGLILGVATTNNFCNTANTTSFGNGDGSSANPFEICTPQQLQNVGLSAYVGGSYYFQLVTNLDMTSFSQSPGFQPIGTTSKPFLGTLNGGGNTISNLTINTPSNNYVGLFGYSYNNGSAQVLVQNLTLSNVNITGSNYTGGLFGSFTGWSNTVAVQNISVSGTISGGSNVGGILGFQSGGWVQISNCTSTANITGSGSYVGGITGNALSLGLPGHIYTSTSSGTITGASYVGGIAGYVGNQGTVSGSSSSATVVVSPAGGNYEGGLAGYVTQGSTVSNSHFTGSVSGGYDAGGVVGYLDGSQGTGPGGTGNQISNSWSSGSVSGSGSVGGLLGYLISGSTISNSYATGSVTGSTGALYVGGLVGQEANSNATQITNSYAAGSVTPGPGLGGGLVAYCTGTKCGTASSSYYDSQVTGQSASQDTNNSKTTTLMQTQSTFSGWDFSGTWYAPVSGVSYPTLR